VSDTQRPRPQFGEYATPEEQKRAIKVPLDDAESMPVESKESPTSHISVQGRPKPVDSTPRPSGDRIATMVLLGVGLMTILVSMASLVDLASAIEIVYAQQGIGEFTSIGIANALGWTALVLELVLWGLALWLSLRALKRGKAAWWIPLVLGVIANIVVLLFVLLALTSDPALAEYVTRMSGTPTE
jgi:hypothetical protein